MEMSMRRFRYGWLIYVRRVFLHLGISRYLSTTKSNIEMIDTIKGGLYVVFS